VCWSFCHWFGAELEKPVDNGASLLKMRGIPFILQHEYIPMSDNNLWCGYLEAGERSSAVLMDDRLNTSDPTTIYVFNLQRGEILEYKRAIVESKLRELKDDEQGLSKELKAAYRKVRNSFVPRGAKVSSIPEKGRPAASKQADEEFSEEVSLEDKFDVDTNDDEDDEE